MPKDIRVKDLNVYLDEEFSPNDITPELVGNKGYSLFKLRNIDVPVPPFMVLSSKVFSQFIAKALEEELNQSTVSSQKIKEQINRRDFEKELRTEILTMYSRLSGFADSWVAIRPSLVFPQNKKGLAMPGLMDPILNVKGIDDIVLSIKNIYSSAFEPKVASYLINNGISISDIKIAVVIQKMIQAETSGVAYTVDPISQDESKMTIESVFGLGSVIANGEITPDQYILNKSNLEYYEKKIVPQTWMMVRKINKKAGESGEQKVQISASWQHQQKLDNKYIEELAKISLIIEKRTGAPQDIEWVFESGRLWILQTENVRIVKLPFMNKDSKLEIDQSIIDAAKKIAEREQSKQEIKEEIKNEKIQKQNTEEQDFENQEEPFVSKPLSRQIVNGLNTNNQRAPESFDQNIPNPDAKANRDLANDKLILTGLGASNALFRGNAVIITTSQELELKSKSIGRDTVLILPEVFNQAEGLLMKIGGLIVETGGITSEAAVMCRERGIPCIMGGNMATKLIKDGDEILVDGRIGAIYGKINKSAKIATPKTAVKSEESKDLDTEISLKKDKSKTATKIYINLSKKAASLSKLESSIEYSDGVCTIRVEDIYKSIIKRHPLAYINEGKKQELIDKLAAPLTQLCSTAGSKRVIVSVGSMSVSKYKNLIKGGQFEKWDESSGINDNTAGLKRLLNQPKELDAILEAVKTVRNKEGWKNLSLAVDFNETPKSLIAFKKSVTASGLRRSSTFKIFMVIDTPSEAMIIDDFVSTGIDGVIINVKNLAKYMMASSIEDDSVQNIIEKIYIGCLEETVILQLPMFIKSLIELGVKLGVQAISIPPKDLDQLNKQIAETERSLIFG